MALPSVRRWSALTHMILIIIVVASVCRCRQPAKLVDDDDNEVPPGQPGELCVKGPQVMLGYWQRPDATDEIIKNGWLHTGDIAVMDEEGFLRIVDCKKDMILVSGFNVYPNEIEDVVMQHPGVQEVAAVGVPSGSSGEAVKIFVVKKRSIALPKSHW